MKKKILIFAGYYTPSFKGGGPIQSISNLVNVLNFDFEFYILAFDRDLGDKKPFNNINKNVWNKVEEAKVIYVKPDKINFQFIRAITNQINFHAIYLNSLFSFNLTILPLILNKLKLIKVSKIVLAPRGQLSKGALGINQRKKQFFIKLGNYLKLYDGLTWHVTANEEKKEVKKYFKANEIYNIKNLTINYNGLDLEKNIRKRKGKLKIIFISRISPKKNLGFVIDTLNEVKGSVELNIFGPIEDVAYWRKCQNKIEALNPNIDVNYCGLLKHSQVINQFKKNHIFFFPTLGENFGHVIFESLIGGCPIVLSDQTPWRKLREKNIGWDIDLKNKKTFIKVIQEYVLMNQEEYNKTSRDAYIFGSESSSHEDVKDLYRNMFLN